MPPGEGILTDLVEETLLSGAPDAHGDRPVRYRAIVNCGRPVRDMKVEIRDDDGAVLGDRQIGRIYCSGHSVMIGYFRDPEATEACLKGGWVDTGDMAYIAAGNVLILRRSKDHMLANGNTP